MGSAKDDAVRSTIYLVRTVANALYQGEHTCEHSHAHIHLRTHKRTRAHTHTHAHTHALTYTYARTYGHITRAHTCAHSYAHTHAHAHNRAHEYTLTYSPLQTQARTQNIHIKQYLNKLTFLFVINQIPELVTARAVAANETRKLMRRLTKDNFKQLGRHIGKITHSNPLVMCELLVGQIQVCVFVFLRGVKCACARAYLCACAFDFKQLSRHIGKITYSNPLVMC